MKTKTLFCLLMAVALAITAAVRAKLRQRESERATSALDHERAKLRQSAARLEQQLQTARNEIAQSKQNAAMALGENGVGSETGSGSGGEPLGRSANVAWQPTPQTVIANDPQKLAEIEQNVRDCLDFWCGATFRALRLSPEQIGQFKELRWWDTQFQLDLQASAEMQGLDLNGTAYKELVQAHKKLVEQKEADLFGPGLADAYREYDLTGYLRETVRRLASCEMYPDAPITSAQVERAIEIVASNSQRKPRQSWGQSWDTINWEAVTTQIPGVLSPSQLATLQLFIQPRIAQGVMMKRSAWVDAEAQRLSRQPGN